MTDNSVTARNGTNFSEELEDIKQERLDRGIDKKRKSTRRLTNLIVKHRDWGKIKADTIEVNLEGKNEK